MIAPLLGHTDTLIVEDWKKIKDNFSAYQAWLGVKPATAVESLGIARIRQILDGGYQEKINMLIAARCGFCRYRRYH
ncbi:MAG: hypothetical protein RQ714_08545 [Nitrosomonas sp.]|nr:hypothetical protein [Nitrosomonas sp.]